MNRDETQSIILVKDDEQRFLQTVISIVYNILLAGLFYILSTDPTKYDANNLGGESCYYLREVSYYFALFGFIFAFFLMFVFIHIIRIFYPIMICLDFGSSFIDLLDSIIRFIFYLLFIGALIQFEQCSYLKYVAIGYVLICSSVIVLMLILKSISKTKEQ
ncbi:hypothetical protein pb186bvf_004144 [Paramecium bursaria]